MEEQQLGMSPSPYDSRTIAYAVRSATPEDMVTIPDEWDGMKDIAYCLGSQGNIGSCGGWAGAGLMKVLIRLNDNLDILPSAGAIYHQSRTFITPPPTGDGTSAIAVMRALQKIGAAPESCAETDTKAPFEISYCDNWRDEAGKYKIGTYRRVPLDPDSIKAAIWGVTYPQPYGGKTPLFIAVPVWQSFFTAHDDGVVPMPKDGEKYRGGHALIIRGWKKIGSGYYWIIVNSWGASLGDNGIYYLPFEYPMWEAWMVTDDEPLPKPTPPEPQPDPSPQPDPQPDPQPQPQPEPDNKSWWQKILDTILDFFRRMFS